MVAPSWMAADLTGSGTPPSKASLNAPAISALAASTFAGSYAVAFPSGPGVPSSSATMLVAAVWSSPARPIA
jgi:hypothetical protein